MQDISQWDLWKRILKNKSLITLVVTQGKTLLIGNYYVDLELCLGCSHNNSLIARLYSIQTPIKFEIIRNIIICFNRNHINNKSKTHTFFHGDSSIVACASSKPLKSRTLPIMKFFYHKMLLLLEPKWCNEKPLDLQFCYYSHK